MSNEYAVTSEYMECMGMFMTGKWPAGEIKWAKEGVVRGAGCAFMKFRH
jgi:hypothetical protein